MSELVVLVPVLNRPHRVAPTQDAFEGRVLFIASPDDASEHDALKAAGVEWIISRGGYARKIAAGVEATREPLIFTAADDLEPHEGWFEAAAQRLADGVEVVGVNDLIERPREHATHFLMTRRYAERPTIDNQPGPFHRGYAHWFCDDELIATARKRGVYVYALDAIVEHRHPMVGKAPDDSTYERGRERRREDARLFKRRRRLWR